MRPILFELGPLEVHGYGLMMALAALGAWWVLGRELERRGVERLTAAPVAIAGFAGGLVGARLYYVAEHAGELAFWGSLAGTGFTWYGGVLGGAVAVLVTARVRRIPLPALLGAAALALPIAYAIGRIGCQLAGDGTYGVASDLPWATAYPNGEDPTTARVHPTPVYETLATLLIFAVLWRQRSRTSGTSLFALYLLLAGGERFLVELIRRNDEVLYGLTEPQLFALAFVAAGAVGLAWTAQTRSVDDAAASRA